MTEPIDLGTCARVLDESSEEICNNKATEEVLVRSKFGLFAVPLCRNCKREHFAFYAALRSRSRSRRARVSQSRGRTGDSTNPPNGREVMQQLPRVS